MFATILNTFIIIFTSSVLGEIDEQKVYRVQNNSTNRQSRFLGLFTLVQFPDDECESSDAETRGTDHKKLVYSCK